MQPTEYIQREVARAWVRALKGVEKGVAEPYRILQEERVCCCEDGGHVGVVGWTDGNRAPLAPRVRM